MKASKVRQRLTSKPKGLDLGGLAVRLASEMVGVLANMSAGDDVKEATRIEGFLYRELEANCRIKAEMLLGLLKDL